LPSLLIPVPLSTPNALHMKTALVRIAALLFVSVLAACGSDEPGSARLRGLKTGVSLQEALQQMGQGPLTATDADTAQLANGYRRMRYRSEEHTSELQSR